MQDNIFIFIIVGFLAQIIDGALGMAYGVISTTFLLSLGLPISIASATVHVAEVFTTFFSGLSHLKLGNVNKNLFKNLLFPGMIGGILGAYILSSLPGKSIEPFVSVYLLLMGVIILIKSRNRAKETKFQPGKKLSLLALSGGFLDAIGGGGWGPIVTSTLVAKGNNPRYTIGSVNATEFFVTVVEALTFIIVIKSIQWEAILGLIIGGAIASPFAALFCKKIPAKTLMKIVGILIICLSIRTILISTFH